MRFLLILLLANQLIADGYILLIPLYREKQGKRKKEYIRCLKKNLAHPLIEHIHILYDTSRDPEQNGSLLRYLKNKPVSISYINSWQTFEDFFDLANTLYPDHKIIIANADIYFNKTLFLLNKYDFTNKFIALTRWEDIKGSIEMRRINDPATGQTNSQDVWIFTTPIQIQDAAIPIGTIGCDPYIALQAEKSGFMVIDPCLSIQCCHVHESGIRNYNQNQPYDRERGKELFATYLE